MENQKDYTEELKKIMGRRQKSLETAIGKVAEAVGLPTPGEAEVAAFFHDLIDGAWDAYEEATAHTAAEMKVLDHEILKLESEIFHVLGEENRDLLNQYSSLINQRTTSELEHSYLVGYQTGIRLLLMGSLPLKSFTTGAEDDDSAEEGEN